MTAETLRTGDDTLLALYLHIPFCHRRCTYCDFNTYADLDDRFFPYARALAQEIHAGGRGERVMSIFFGGGTPSILPLALLGDILAACRDAFAVGVGAEITLEANPGTVDVKKLSGLLQTGFNRLSLGVQSARPSELALLGRSHTFEQARQAVAMARTAGYENISLDVIYGLPGQSLADWGVTLDATLALAPDHLSCYGLSVEEGTPLAAQIEAGLLPQPDPDTGAAMYELAEAWLDEAGFEHYEISNWAKPGCQCRHNLVYWRNEAYVGFGAGAHSYRDQKRWWNVLAPDEYIARVTAGESPVADMEQMGLDREMGETMMMGLRLSEGVATRVFQRRFQRTLMQVYGQELEELEAANLIEWDGQRVRLTARGRLLGNQVFVRFL
jgi:oxygen-independent coproporphyrinogen-3 oxidase